ncbi:MAG: hypothetical protein OEM77_05800 [Nitrosopumilus sp.]|nr:hypothetical protein [Nitrosopumilus sp.]MDH3823256.1 hypothetical protein [Nitrosopumilus sp.]
MVNEAEYDSKPDWNVSGKLCSECYDYKYVHDPKSFVNKSFFRKILKISKKKWLIAIITSLLVFSVIMRIIVQN